jgi:hypothetical protein
LRRFGRRTLHRTLVISATAPFAVAAGLSLFSSEGEWRAAASNARAARSGGWAVVPEGHRASDPGAVAAETSVVAGPDAPVGSTDAPERPESLVIGRGPGGRGARDGLLPGKALPPGLQDSTIASSKVKGTSGTTTLPGSAGNAPGASTADPTKTPSVEDLPPGTGLRGEYWDYDAEITHIPNLDLSGATLVRLDPVVDFPADGWNLPFRPLETWATCWRGYFKATTTGHYAFVLGTDDGGILEIDNNIVCGQDRLQGYFESRGELDLASGLHVIKIRYFNNRGPGVCRLFYVPPGGGDPAIVTQDLLYPSGGLADVGRPTVTSVSPANAKRGDTITITGTNFADVPPLNTVTFGPANVPAVVTDATATQLTVIVPNGVDQGPIVVTTGDLMAAGVPYTVGGIFGLFMRTWRATDGNDVTTYMDPQTSQPTDDEQIVGPLDCHGPASFLLPFNAEQFRSCYTGRFWVQTAGDFNFALESDDGSQLLVDSTLLINDGGLHGRNHVEGKTFLNQGWHDVRIDFFQNWGGADLSLYVAVPGATALAVCPRALLAPPIELDALPYPTVTAVNPSPAQAGDRILITGQGLTAPDGRMPTVLLGAVSLPVIASSAGSIAASVPPGVDSGNLVVKAGPLASAPVSLAVTGYGLKAELWHLPGPLSVLPPFNTPPDLTRTDDNVDYTEDSAFKLPWTPDHFAIRWTGNLYVPADGSYELTSGSDDGSQLSVDGRVVVDNDGLHGYSEVASTVALTAGQHTITLLFFQNEGDARCRLLWNPPGSSAGRVPIPRTNLLPAN